MKVRQLSFLLFFLADAASAQELNAGSRLLSMGNTGAALQDVWSMHANPAGIAVLSDPAAAITYQKNFPGTEISTEAAVLVVPVRKHVFGLSCQSFGFSACKEFRVGLAYARRFGEAFFTAVGFNYHQLSIPSYGRKSTVSVDVGMQYRPLRKLMVGVHISNLSSASYDGSSGAFIPTVLSVGAAYRFSEELLWSTTVSAAKHGEGADFRTGLEYSVLRQIALRAGIEVQPFNQYIGLGYRWQHLSVDLAVSNHFVLGYTPQISLAYAF